MIGLPKPRPHALVKRDRQAALRARDEAENRKVRKRSGGWCEIWTQTYWTDPKRLPKAIHIRCGRRASQVHHMKDGIGVRGRGDSALAAWKQHLCDRCHADVTGHVLVPLDPQADALHVIFRRIR